MYKVALCIAGLAPAHGGPSRSVPALAEALSELGVSVELIFCREKAEDVVEADLRRGLVRTRILSSVDRSFGWLARNNGFYRTILGVPSSRLLVHDNGIWLANNHAVAIAAKHRNLPRLVSPRGMLTAWSMQHRAWKKRLAWWLYQKRDLSNASVLHATAESEAKDFRHAGLSQPIAVIPNGVELADYPPRQVRPSSSRTVLFLSRIHPKKGLLDLVEAWAMVKPNGWQVVVAGAGEHRHAAEVKDRCRERGVAGDFRFVGPVEGEAKWKLYRNADLFVLPTKSENFGMVVPEALACGVPVITTKGAPWEDLVTRQCGWWIDLGIAPLARALKDATKCSDETRWEMGARGRKLVEAKYSWTSVGKKMLSLYCWMLGQGDRPPCVSSC